MFTCDHCGGTLPAANTLDDALDEARGLFGPVVDETDNGLLCDDCFDLFVSWAQAEGLLQGGASS